MSVIFLGIKKLHKILKVICINCFYKVLLGPIRQLRNQVGAHINSWLGDVKNGTRCSFLPRSSRSSCGQAHMVPMFTHTVPEF